MMAEILSKHDLVPKIIKYLDPHMTINILDFLAEENRVNVYTVKSLLKAKHLILAETLMVDYRNAVYRELHDLPENENEPGYTVNREFVIEKYMSATRSAKEISRLISDSRVASLLENGLSPDSGDPDQNPPIVKSKEEAMSMLYEFATTTYNVGSFDSCHEVLTILQKATSDKWEYSLSCLWGRLACEILMGQFESALEQFNILRERIEQTNFLNHNEALSQRTWLLHWSLFVLFDQNRSFCEGIIDLFLQPYYLSTISINCPWLLRYLTIAIIINKRRRSNIKDLINVIQGEVFVTDDPFVLFIKSLYIDYDFAATRDYLSLCRQLIDIDFFTHRFASEFMESARITLLENYFRIHHKIDVLYLCDTLGMEHSEGEKWIADVISSIHFDSGIDTITNTAILNVQRKSVYQQVLESTKTLISRTSSLASSLEKREQELEDRSRLRA